MGQSPSAPPSTHVRRRRSLRSPFRRNNDTLSATFNFIDSPPKINQLNLNQATEEELMTLPGVTRSIARNIVDYRFLIGRFNKVEDLALVSGIGAEKLDEIRPEICVVRKKIHSCASSRTPSMDSLSVQNESPRLDSRLIDVNSATLFDLMSVRGITQELAAAIIDYRERRGDFFTINDLLKVKGMNAVRLGPLKSQLIVKSDLRPIGNSRPKSEPLRISNGRSSFESSPSFPRTPLPFSPSLSPKMLGGVPPSDQLYDLVASYCPRPTPRAVPPPHYFRIGTWHLTNLNVEKAQNKAVREVFCLTLLENRISFVALQGVEDSQGLRMLCDEFKFPTCRRVQDWKGSRGNWVSQFIPMHNTNGGPSLGFMYDTQVLRHILVKVIQDNSMMLVAEAILNHCGDTLDVLNVQLLSNTCHPSLNTLLDAICPSVVLGDFTILRDCDKNAFSLYRPILPRRTSTSSTSGVSHNDNVYFRFDSFSKYNGICDVVRNGLTHLAIPHGWCWGGAVSQHCPVWAEVNLRTPSTSPNGV